MNMQFRAWNGKEMIYFDFSGTGDLSVYAYEGEVTGIMLPDRHTVLMHNESGLHPQLIIMSRTGRVDWKNQVIYESDIIELRAIYETFNCAIKWNDRLAGFEVQAIGRGYRVPFVSIHDREIAIVGNIHENPELLEAE